MFTVLTSLSSLADNIDLDLIDVYEYDFSVVHDVHALLIATVNDRLFLESLLAARFRLWFRMCLFYIR